MLSKFSVKKPFTVLVAVILILVLGVISFTGMTTDLLPSLELPYIIVATTYPGASPEKVEMAVTKPLEQVLGTTSGIKNVTSTSNENMSMVILEFVQGTNMDSATIELSGNIDLVAAQLPDEVGAPMLLKLSPDMLPIMVAAVDVNNMDIKQISQYASEVVIPELERIDGVASVEVSGLVEEKIYVTLNSTKIDELNNKVLQSVDEELAKAQRELNDGKNKIADGQKKLADGKNELTTQKDEAMAKLSSGSAQVDGAAATLSALLAEETTLNTDKAAFEAEKKGYEEVTKQYNTLNGVFGTMNLGKTISDLAAMSSSDFNTWYANLPNQLPPEIAAMLTLENMQKLQGGFDAATARLPQIDAELNNISMRLMVLTQMKPQLQDGLNQAQNGYTELEKGKLTAVNELTKAEIMLQNTETELKKAEESIKEAEEKFNESRDAAYKKADISGLITADMLANILKAQNFSMPAGYIKDGDEKYLLKVGDQFKTQDEIKNLLLMNIDIDGVGDIYLSDVADIQLKSNENDSYAKINGNNGVVLTFQKQSTASTAAVSDKINATFKRLAEQNPDMHISALMDQGDYIDLIINSVLQNLIFGGILAIFVLALFLKDIKPTFIVACSIPLSLFFAITLMYFSNVTLNIISLSGLALGVGMLVDNSIVVIENIYRLRSDGMSAAKAAVKGATQVAGAIFASTLTTVCVFLPIVFTQGISRQLFTDMGLTIAYSLLASLIVALTLVPAMGATVLRTTKEKKHPWFDAFVRGYLKTLKFSLKHKAITMLSVLALFVLSIFLITQMGAVFMPAMDSPQMSLSIKMPKGTKKQDAYKLADEAMQRLTAVDSVETVGLMDGGAGGMMGMSMGSSSQSSQISFSAYVLVDLSNGKTNSDIAADLREVLSDMPFESSVQESTMNMSALGGSGIELSIKGRELDEMNNIANDLRQMLADVEGVTDISQPGTGNLETRVTVNKEKAMAKGLTVAQVYAELAKSLADENTATNLSTSDGDLPVVVVKDEAMLLSKATLSDFKFTVKDASGEESEISLSEIADISQTESVKAINRENSVRTMSVTAAVDAEHNIGLVGRDVQNLLSEYTVPTGYSVELLGENETINSAFLDLAKMIALAVVFIYLIMVAQFQSLVSPFIVMFTIPLAFTGGLLALWVCGMPLSITSILGFLVLAGIVVNNGIVFVDYINQLRLDGTDKIEAILETGRARIRPVLMTALTTILAMSTMAIGTGMGAEMTQPMAIVTIGGLTYATLLTLIVVPVMYDLMRRKPMQNVDIGED